MRSPHPPLSPVGRGRWARRRLPNKILPARSEQFQINSYRRKMRFFLTSNFEVEGNRIMPACGKQFKINPCLRQQRSPIGSVRALLPNGDNMLPVPLLRVDDAIGGRLQRFEVG